MGCEGVTPARPPDREIFGGSPVAPLRLVYNVLGEDVAVLRGGGGLSDLPFRAEDSGRLTVYTVAVLGLDPSQDPLGADAYACFWQRSHPRRPLKSSRVANP